MSEAISNSCEEKSILVSKNNAVKQTQICWNRFPENFNKLTDIFRYVLGYSEFN